MPTTYQNVSSQIFPVKELVKSIVNVGSDQKKKTHSQFPDRL